MCFGYEQIVPATTVLGVARQPGLLDDVGAHEQVVEVEVGRAGHVGADAADPGGQVDHQVGPGVVEAAGPRRRGGAGRSRPSAGVDEPADPALPQPLADGPPEEAPARR